MKARIFAGAVLVMASVFCAGAAGVFADNGGNLVPDPEFSRADFTPPQIKRDTTWMRFQIEAPSEAEVEDASVRLTGGKIFLHSTRFEVNPGAGYNFGISAEGNAKVGVQLMWWPWPLGDDVQIKTVTQELRNGEATISDSVKAPEGAEKALLRVIVEEGTAAVRSPEVTEK